VDERSRLNEALQAERQLYSSLVKFHAHPERFSCVPSSPGCWYEFPSSGLPQLCFLYSWLRNAHNQQSKWLGFGYFSSNEDPSQARG
ncbi:PDE4DIP isoform 30, partial [Pan troglodytes]